MLTHLVCTAKPLYPFFIAGTSTASHTFLLDPIGLDGEFEPSCFDLPIDDDYGKLPSMAHHPEKQTLRKDL